MFGPNDGGHRAINLTVCKEQLELVKGVSSVAVL